MCSLPNKSKQAHDFLNLNITQHILSTHPNSFTVHPDIQLPEVNWLTLFTENPTLPDSICSFLATARQLQLTRSPIVLDALPLLSEHGMAPKSNIEAAVVQ
jgi:hypothetical protein